MIDRFDGEYSFLSNFYPSPLKFGRDRLLYPTAEHAFQAMKTHDAVWRNKIRLAPSPGVAKRLGRQCPLREDWDRSKVRVMTAIVRLKFKDPALRAKLLATGDEELIEGNYWNDRFWGVCRGKGQNHLGKILMDIREECRTH